MAVFMMMVLIMTILDYGPHIYISINQLLLSFFAERWLDVFLSECDVISHNAYVLKTKSIMKKNMTLMYKSGASNRRKFNILNVRQHNLSISYNLLLNQFHFLSGNFGNREILNVKPIVCQRVRLVDLTLKISNRTYWTNTTLFTHNPQPLQQIDMIQNYNIFRYKPRQQGVRQLNIVDNSLMLVPLRLGRIRSSQNGCTSIQLTNNTSLSNRQRLLFHNLRNPRYISGMYKA